METTGANYNEAITALNQVIPKLSKISHQRKKVADYNSSLFSTSQHFTAKSSAENATSPALDGKKSKYEAFKNSSHHNCIDVSEYKYMFCKALETKLMVEVTKKARVDKESGLKTYSEAVMRNK
eukprot:13104103-Ditylum_brightwellii.AAC.1